MNSHVLGGKPLKCGWGRHQLQQPGSLALSNQLAMMSFNPMGMGLPGLAPVMLPTGLGPGAPRCLAAASAADAASGSAAGGRQPRLLLHQAARPAAGLAGAGGAGPSRVLTHRGRPVQATRASWGASWG